MCGRYVFSAPGRKSVPLTLGMNQTVTGFFDTFRCVYFLLFLCIAESVTFSQAYNITVKEGDIRILNCSLPNLGPNTTDSRLNCSRRGSNISLTLIQGKCHGNISGLMQINRTNAGSYNCCNSIGNCSAVDLIVHYLAEVHIYSYPVTIKPGENFTLHCKVESVPAVSEIYWYYDNVRIPGVKNLSLIANCSRDVSYTCSPKNSWGTARNATKVVNLQVPDPPRNPLAKPVPNGIEVCWKAPANINQCTAFYQIFFRKTGEGEWRTRNTSELSHTLKEEEDLLTSGDYRIRLKAFIGFKGSNFSSTERVKFVKEDKTGGSTWPIVIGIVLGILLVVAVIGLVLRFRTRRCSLSAHCIGFFSVPDGPSPPSPTKKPSIRFKRGPIPVESFASHVKYLHSDGDYRFDQEFEALRGIHAKGRSWIQSGKPENQPKNRYANVIPYDHSRVVLSLSDDDLESHYINANYIDSYKQINAYIATQGPMANTIGDFWRMVWEQNCSVIVMVTNVIEKGRHKCAMYWPSKQAKSEVHGPIRITHLDEESFSHYIVRRFEIKPTDHSTHYSQDMIENEVEPMIVTQYHFLGWPDHGAPDTGLEYPAVDFILRSAAASREGSGPIVVHCSAGVGRSGAYIVIHSMMTRMHDTRDLDIFDFLCHIRQQRNLLVQEESQYIFVHDALLHYIESDFKIAIPIEDLKGHLHNLRRNLPNPSTGKTKLEVEFEKLNSIQVKHYNLKQAKRACNASKNRSMDFIPADSTRMELFPRPREEGSDYINASYLDGFWKAGAYIATQYPLENTLDDFWRMIWQENCRSIVMLVSKQELQQGYFPTYLPVLYDMARFNKFEVTVDSEVTRGDIIVRELRMVSVQDPSEVRKIRHFHFLHWPEDGMPWSGQTILQLVDKVDSWEKEVRSHAKPFEMIGGIVVHCNYGVGRTGAYCLLHTMYHQIARDKTVSIYQMTRLYNYQRPHCLQNQEQYEFCYDTLAEYIDADCSLYLV